MQSWRLAKCQAALKDAANLSCGARIELAWSGLFSVPERGGAAELKARRTYLGQNKAKDCIAVLALGSDMRGKSLIALLRHPRPAKSTCVGAS